MALSDWARMHLFLAIVVFVSEVVAWEPVGSSDRNDCRWSHPSPANVVFVLKVVAREPRASSDRGREQPVRGTIGCPKTS